MTQAEPGQRVGHRAAAGTGTIVEIIGHIALVKWDDGTTSPHYVGTLYPKGEGCALLTSAPAVLLLLCAAWPLLR
jgi:hypothetical protein